MTHPDIEPNERRRAPSSRVVLLGWLTGGRKGDSLYVLVGDGFDIETDGRDGGDGLVQLEFVQDGWVWWERERERVRGRRVESGRRTRASPYWFSLLRPSRA